MRDPCRDVGLHEAMAQYQKSVAVTMLWITQELEQKSEKKQENKEMGGSRKGGNGGNAERDADAEMADA